jgi:hypothetical protein
MVAMEIFGFLVRLVCLGYHLARFQGGKLCGKRW